MTARSETALRMALRHVRQGRRCIERKVQVVEGLHNKGLPTDEAERLLTWFADLQQHFEQHYRSLLSEGLERIELTAAQFRLDLGRERRLPEHKTPLACLSEDPS